MHAVSQKRRTKRLTPKRQRNGHSGRLGRGDRVSTLGGIEMTQRRYSRGGRVGSSLEDNLRGRLRYAAGGNLDIEEVHLAVG